METPIKFAVEDSESSGTALFLEELFVFYFAGDGDRKFIRNWWLETLDKTQINTESGT